MSLISRTPATGEELGRYEPLDDAHIGEKLQRAAVAFCHHRATSFAERARLMHSAADILDAEKQALGRLMTLEMGKPIAAAIAEAGKCALACRYYADNAAHFLADEHVDLSDGSGRTGFIRYQPGARH